MILSHLQMVKDKLSEAAAQGKGWLLDGFPRSSSQAEALEALGLKPDLFIILDVILIFYVLAF